MSTVDVLLVEDNPITRKLVRFALASAGLSFEEAGDGRTALALFSATPPRLVLQDLVLPDMDGFELLRRLRALPGGPEVPVLAFSGMTSKLDGAKLSHSFDDLIPKPVEPSLLIQIVRGHLPTEGRASERVGAGRRVLLVDDDAVQRKLVAFRLQKLGFEVTTAIDGSDAIERVAELAPEIVISDVLMPRLDGFGLCAALRQHERFSGIPVILTTNSYVEAVDRDLAHRVGANDLVARTPDLRLVVDAVHASLKGAAPPVGETSPETERLHVDRIVRQLERQVAINAGLTQRCATLAAELAVLKGISEALAGQESFDEALKHGLAACFDAGGISLGALYLERDGERRVLGFGAAFRHTDVERVFGEPEALEHVLASKTSLAIPGNTSLGRALLEGAGAKSGLMVPLHYQRTRFGALLMLSTTRELLTEDRIHFGEAVAAQISQALALAKAFEERARSERSAKNQASVLNSILDSLADGVVVADRAGHVIHSNPAAAEILRTAAAEGAPSTWPARYGLYEPDQTTRLSPEDVPLVRALGGESLDRRETFMRHEKAPEGAWLSFNARPLRDESGETRGGVVVFRDVTQEKAAQTQLMMSDRMASVGTLAAGVAHEINNPLAAVVANLDLAQEDLARFAEGGAEGLEEVREMIDDARTAADRVRQIVRDLRIFSRHEEARTGAVDVERVLESTIRMAWNELRHRARLEKSFTRPPMVEGNDSRLGQVFLNLIMNAAQAIPEGNAEANLIRIATRAQGGRVVVEIADSGEGIAPEMLSHLFTPFFTTKAPGVGTGLGLAICQRIISDLGGEIQVESALGRGTTFRVILTVADSPRAAEVVAQPVAAVAKRRGRVLVIDDEPAIGAIVRRTLEPAHEVRLVSCAADALALFADQQRFDVILCDMMMPQMTGMQLYELVHETMPDQAERFIFLTGGAFTPATRAFLDTVPNQRVEKPFDPRHLRALINDRIV